MRHGGKVTLALGLFCLSAHAADGDIDRQTRACVVNAGSTAAVVRCEQQAQAAWRARIEEHRQALLERLQGPERNHFLAAQAAWEDYRVREFRFIDDSFAQRTDGLSPPLAAGAKTELLRQRAERLAVYLSNPPPAMGK